MEDSKFYEIDINEIKKDYKFKEDDEIKQGKCNLTHSQCNKLKLLPFIANDKKLVSNFDGVIGEFSRIICDKEMKDSFDVNEFISNVVEEVADFEGKTSKQDFKSIIKAIYINNNKLVDFDIKTMNYIDSTSSEEKYAMFLFSLFVDDELKEQVKALYSTSTNNILNRLILHALPELKEKKKNIIKYMCYLPFVKGLFKQDFQFLMTNEDLYNTYAQRLLEFYNMFYISQLCFKLSQFEKADLSKPEPLYYTLGWESTSKNRTAYRLGYEKLKEPMDSLFSHAITLELLNHNNINEQLGYVDLYNAFQNNESEEIANDIENLIEKYIAQVCDKEWNEFVQKTRSCDNKAFTKVYKLFDVVEFQFFKSGRSRAYEAYKNWFKKFVEDNFGKRRGSLGYNLNLNEEDIILLTKICINNRKKLKLKELFNEFEGRGVFFDRDSKMKIIQLYEKLNLLEKKSDSGDAQYVRSIL